MMTGWFHPYVMWPTGIVIDLPGFLQRGTFGCIAWWNHCGASRSWTPGSVLLELVYLVFEAVDGYSLLLGMGELGFHWGVQAGPDSLEECPVSVEALNNDHLIVGIRNCFVRLSWGVRSFFGEVRFSNSCGFLHYFISTWWCVCFWGTLGCTKMSVRRYLFPITLAPWNQLVIVRSINNNNITCNFFTFHGAYLVLLKSHRKVLTHLLGLYEDTWRPSCG